MLRASRTVMRNRKHCPFSSSLFFLFFFFYPSRFQSQFRIFFNQNSVAIVIFGFINLLLPILCCPCRFMIRVDRYSNVLVYFPQFCINYYYFRCNFCCGSQLWVFCMRFLFSFSFWVTVRHSYNRLMSPILAGFHIILSISLSTVNVMICFGRRPS